MILSLKLDIPYRDRRKYNSLVDNIVQRGLLDDFARGFDTFDIFSKQPYFGLQGSSIFLFYFV